MPIVRFEPGAEAPRAGTYALTGEWGEPAGESAFVLEGQRLPLLDTAEEPRWYVLAAPAEEAPGMATATRGPGVGEVKARRIGARSSPPGEHAAALEEAILTPTGKDG